MVKPNWDNFKAKFSENPQGNLSGFATCCSVKNSKCPQVYLDIRINLVSKLIQ